MVPCLKIRSAKKFNYFAARKSITIRVAGFSFLVWDTVGDLNKLSFRRPRFCIERFQGPLFLFFVFCLCVCVCMGEYNLVKCIIMCVYIKVYYHFLLRILFSVYFSSAFLVKYLNTKKST